jgi:hypothetical protein
MVMQAAPDRSESGRTDQFGQVLPFRRRPSLTLAQPHQPANAADDAFARYEQEQEEPLDDRQRMLMNAIAAAIVIVLISAGVWIADTISVTVKAQDCALQGRSNCAPIETPARH